MLRFFAFVVLLAIASATNFRQCTNQPSATAVRVQGCDKMPCSVYKGKDSVMEIDFKALKDADTLDAKVVATALGIKVPYPLPNDVGNVCKHLLNDGYCPLDAGEDATYKFSLAVASVFPEIPATIEIKIVDGDNKVHACLEIDIQVLSA